MIETDYQLQLHEALSKAFAAQSSDVRGAYFELANFYHEKLGDEARLMPSHEELRRAASKRKEH